MSSARDKTHPNESAFPSGVGGPVLRALARAGIRSMDELTEWSEADLSALHGVGPKGIRVLKEGLAKRGLRLRRGQRPPHQGARAR